MKRESDDLFKGMSSHESSAIQLCLWVDGISYHNPVRDECCPDFSCCKPSFLAEKELRVRFQQAWENDEQEVMHQLLLMFLERAKSKGLYLAGTINNDGVTVPKDKLN